MASDKRLKALEEKAAAAQKKLDEIKAQRRALENAVKAKERAAERKRETRQKILLGAFVLDRLKGHTDFMSLTLDGLKFGDWLTRPEDRKVFEKAAAPAPKPAPAPATPKPAAPAAPVQEQFPINAESKPATPSTPPAAAPAAPLQGTQKTSNWPTYLNTGFGDKDAVRALGAKWDGEKKKWFVPAGQNLVPFAKWLQ